MILHQKVIFHQKLWSDDVQLWSWQIEGQIIGRTDGQMEQQMDKKMIYRCAPPKKQEDEQVYGFSEKKIHLGVVLRCQD